jgi:hypothetical protein
MQKIKIGLYLSLLLVVLSTFSCKKVVQSEFPDIVQKPVVNSILQVDSTLVLNISFNGNLDASKIKQIENATVNIFVDNILTETISNGEDGLYISNIIVEPNKNYSCEIEVPGYKTLTCNAKIPTLSEIVEIVHEPLAYTDPEGTIFPSTHITFENNPDTIQYFEIIIKNLRSYNNEEHNYYASLVGIDDPILINEGLPIAVFSNELISGTSYTMSLNYNTMSSSWNIADTYPYIVELRSVSYDYYKYAKQLYLFKESVNNDNLTGTCAPVQLYSNINEGFGIFTGYSTYISDTIFPENISAH